VGPRHWYHCTADDHGPRFVADRRWPKDTNRDAREPLTPRLCVGPSVPACLAAVLFVAFRRPVFVYRTEAPRRANRPVGVWDEVVTRERWIVPPAPMVLVDVVDEDAVEAAQAAVWYYHHRSKQNSDLRVRVAQLALAVEAVGRYHPHLVTPGDRRHAAKCLGALGMPADAEEWLFERAERDRVKKLTPKPAGAGT
jgi:hypothetical protein